MDITITPKKLPGVLNAVASKSHAHRVFLCAALADMPTEINIQTFSADLDATISCITGFGAKVQRKSEHSIVIEPIDKIPSSALCHCGESGSTLRFCLPLAGALGIETLFILEGRLPHRPLSPLWEEMEQHGCRLRWVTGTELESHRTAFPSATAALRLTGRLQAGHYQLDGSISSQFISGLMMALPLLNGPSELELTGALASRPYIDLTTHALRQFGVSWSGNVTTGNQCYKSPGTIRVEGDWSNSAFWLTANALGSNITLNGLNEASVQGDKAIVSLLANGFDNHQFSALNFPDLVPILAVYAAANQGAVITDISRLRLKESDRVQTVLEMINGLGGKALADDNTLTVFPSPLVGGTVDSHNDHRIAMAAAVASTVCSRPVTILGAECVNKSYPDFWKDFSNLGGKYEFHLR